MPFNLIEALGVGKTVLASRVKGHVDLIDEGIDGFLYTCGDTGDFVNKVLLIYNGKISPDPEMIAKKYSKYEKSSVFPETYSVMKEVIK
jgi:glycosyltransferase EpsD